MSAFPVFSSGQLANAASGGLSWLWHGYLAAGNVTLLTSQWKSGKTTLVAVLAARMGEGGSLAGLKVKPGKVAIVSKETSLNWHGRAHKLHFGNHIAFFCRPFNSKPSMEQWGSLIEAMVQLQQQQGLDLVVIDPLASFLPGSRENLADGLLEVLLQLQRLTNLGMSVLIVHHPRKGQVRAGQASRGSGVLGGYVDILLEMSWYGHPTSPDRRRVIEAYSRHDETPRRQVIELSADGTDYLSHGDLHEDDFTRNWLLLRTILAAADHALTRLEIRRRWPGGQKKPDDATLWRWLQRVLAEEAVVQEGAGKRNDPYRFRLAQSA